MSWPPSRGDGRYEGVRAERARLVAALCETRFNSAFGNDDFLTLAKTAPVSFDVLCHHGAQVGDYRSPDFDPYQAAAANLYRLPEALRVLKDRGCGRLVLTGSVFEANEGVGSAPLRAFSPYGLSKTLTATAAAFYAEQQGVTFEKFVIPNPFGPYEEPRFTAYLMKSWLADETARVQTPRYVRDNIQVTLLAGPMPILSAPAPAPGTVRRLNPSGYPESQGAFAQRVRAEVAPGSAEGLRAGARCADRVSGAAGAESIPTVPMGRRLGWSEIRAWDEFVRYYL